MGRQLGQLVRLVDDLLDVNRITYNRLELRRERVALSAVIRQAIETAGPIIDAARHTVELSMPETPCYLYGDSVRLTQAFSNLLNNAAKYTNERGTISVGATCERDRVIVTVKDTGIGIAPDKIERIFDMFAQADGTIERSQGGLGIGLALVKQLIEMHGGTVEARSDGEGCGSEFIVRLPMVEEAAVDATRTLPTPDASRKHSILVVDDNSDSAQSLAMLLDTMGHRTFTAYDGHEAMAAIEQQRPDVVLLDIGLPGLSGYEVCQRVRAQEWGKKTTLIALTGWGQEDDRRRTREAGFNGHLVKPVDVEQLMDLLGRLSVGAISRSRTA
jgi:CheY-like chemotaxis protein/anti-sigma regulatory factor (Ser/Thr protein kinase)